MTVGHVLFFAASDVYDGVQLWTSDGTPYGTGQATDQNLYVSEVNSSWGTPGLVAIGNRMFFAATDGVRGMELWAMILDDGNVSVR